ncbi:MAG: DUF4249 domain-containing protein [Bacteroidetes bacterium]|nr:DUF4249 domain-containing protein [Bacteroidota bacterium]
MKKNILLFQKNTRIISLLLIILTVLINISCRKELDNYSINYDKQIVINGFITPDSIVKINVSSTYPANVDNPNKNDVFITDAICLLYENNLFIDTLNYTEKGFYICNFKPTVNKTYKLIVNVKGFNKISATTTIPKKVNFSVNLERMSGYLRFDGKIIFKSPSEDSYFIFNILTKDNTYGYDDLQYHFYNPDMGKFVQNECTINENIFTNTKFKNKTYSINIKYLYVSSDNYTYFWLTTINKDLYLNLKSKKSYKDVKDDIFAEPVNLYSNINGGLGIFAGYNRTQDSLFFASN